MIREICKEMNIPQDSTEVFVSAWEQVQSNAEAKKEFELAAECYFRALEPSLAHLKKVAELTGIVIHTVHYLLGLYFVPQFHTVCKMLGVPEDIYRDTLTDLRGKIFECRDRYGVDGTFVLFWYRRVYTCDVLKIGRLEFEPEQWRGEQYAPLLKKGTPTYHLHILSGEPFTPELVLDSLKRGYEFYHIAETKTKIMILECSSWLLYPPTVALYKKGGNLDRFCSLFDIVSCKESGGFGSAWRVFGVQPTEETLPDMPEDNSMRRAFKQYLLNGGKMGTGHGVFFFDGERVLTKEEAQKLAAL